MADKGILEFVQSTRNIIDADSYAAPVLSSSEMRNVTKRLSPPPNIAAKNRKNRVLAGGKGPYPLLDCIEVHRESDTTLIDTMEVLTETVLTKNETEHHDKFLSVSFKMSRIH
ncbi:hypothetical protein TNCV_313041 [Trichonephila clavipes]|nr:hypothetical protein TNCV_313041 [Trichonephila clavipes]